MKHRIYKKLIESLICVALAKELIYHKIVEVSKEYGVSESVMDYVVRNESSYHNCAVGDTHLTDPEGNKHISRGLVQINEYYNATVTPEQAFDVDFSLRFLAEKLKEGKGRMWTTYRNMQKELLSKK